MTKKNSPLPTAPEPAPSAMEPVKVKTSWGTITLMLENGMVTGCTLPFLKITPRKPFVIETTPGAELIKPFFPPSGRQLRCGTDFFPDIGKLKGTDFQKAVWNEMLKIPRGEVRTYGEIAAAIGRPKAVRAVGTACGANPIPLFIPCHRIVAANGLGGFGSGLPWKKLLLRLEGWNGGRME